VPIGAPEKWQYLLFDSPSQRVFIAHGTEVTVVDTQHLQIAGRVPGFSGVHGIALVPGGAGYGASGKSASVGVFDPSSYRMIATVKADVDAYAAVYDPASRHVFVMNDDAGNITVIDPADNKVVSTIDTGPGLEQAAADGHGHVFIAHSEAHQVLRLDTMRGVVDAAWAIPQCGAPHGLALDNDADRVFVSCPGGVWLAMDARTGRVLATLPIGQGGDALMVDAVRHRIYSPNADGTLSVIDAQDGGHFVAEAPFPIPKGARTGALDPATGRLFLVTADVAQTLPGRAAKFRFVPGTAKLLVYDPAGR
jgi:YVTN family beta-propeller protein